MSDVRLKRTIRNYWTDYKGYNGSNGRDVFIREISYEDKDQEFVQDGKRRAANFRNDPKRILNECIDVRTFGAVIPLNKDSHTYTGPTQFQMGKSLHKCTIATIEGTGAFASGDGKKNKSLRTEYVTPYALVGFNGIVNENAARHTGMTQADRELLLEGIWNGTKNLISRSKFGQMPRLLLCLHYKPEHAYYIGNLRQRIKLRAAGDKEESSIRAITDYTLDLQAVAEEIAANRAKIDSIVVQLDRQLQLSKGSERLDLETKTYRPDEFLAHFSL